MRFQSQALLVALTPLATAFPYTVLEKAARDNPELINRANAILGERQSGAGAASAVFEPIPIFNAEAQYIDVSEGSGHEWQAPTSSDLRGPCPGLNAFANHGFIPRNGYATITEFIAATETVVGMGPLLAIFLAVLGATIDGDGLAWSIGGTPPASIGGVLGTLGNGISGSHNKYESDASPTRPDLYEAGNDYIAQTNQFNKLIAMSPGGTVTMDSLTDFRSYRFDTQIANNKYFFNGPFTGVLVQPAAYTFIFRFMANHTADDPIGILPYDVLASWFAMTPTPANDGTYSYAEGHERIPDNWYRRAQEYVYDTDYFTLDVVNAALLHPKFLDVGGNMGSVNSFAGVDIANLTGGVLNSESLLQGNNLACLAYQASAQVKPDVVLGAVNQLTDALGNLSTKLACPQLAALDESQLQMFPGYTRSGVGSDGLLGGIGL